MAGFCRHQIENLRKTLSDTANRHRAVDALRELIDDIVLVPVESGGRKTLVIDKLQGRLTGHSDAGCRHERAALDRDGYSESVAMVAGARSRRQQQGLFQAAA